MALMSVAAVLGLVVSFTGLAAAGSTPTVSAKHNATLGETIIVNAQGRTLYHLSGDSPNHLLCKSSACLAAWPPLTVPSRHAKLVDGRGVHGHLAILRRSNGMFQVTLRGLLLYRFVGDTSAGTAAGEGINAFGGIWHAVTASASSATPSPSAPAPATNTAPSSSPSYGY
jgi:predicted lipoprotein with Yx(FWY)xxD motif